MPEDDEPQVEDALVAARPQQAPGLALARARIAGSLFGAEAAMFGRFRVLERLGGGGMGVVYAAYDPQLDRGVALKTVHVAANAHDAAVREAKALARLSHPNVVPVFDVGTAEGHVYIVMELVRGTTLRAWVTGREVGEIVDVYTQAARGLAAAHDAGLVHRDMKPENAIVGTDGRVRVVDFGLSVEADAAAGAAGTPRYMAPEQAAGGRITPASDQYSLCVALGEAIEKPPRWIADIIERGTAADPTARFPSMHAVVRALGRDPARVRRRRMLAAAVVVVMAGASAGAFAIGRARSADVCSGGDRELATTWAADAQRADLARIAGLSPYGRDLAALLDRALAAHRTAWVATYHDACIAHRRGVQSDALLDRRMACLDRARSALSTVAQLTRTADAAALPALARAANELPAPSACDAHVGTAEVPPSLGSAARDLERARVELAAGKFVEARTLADGAEAQARGSGYEPLVAEAALLAGRARMEVGDTPGALAKLGDAETTAVRAGVDAIAVEAWARRTWLAATQQTPEGALAGLDLVEALAARSGSAFARALLANNVGSIDLARGQRAEARVAFERALAASGDVTGNGALELVRVRVNLAIVTDDAVKRDRLFVSARDELARRLGRNHPDTISVELARIFADVEDRAEAQAALTDVCTRYDQYAPLDEYAMSCWAELAYVRGRAGDTDGALAAADRARQLGDPSVDYPELAGYALYWRGNPKAAALALNAQLTALAPTPGEPWFRTYGRAKVQLALAEATRANGKDPHALVEAATSTLTAIANDHPAAAIDWRLRVR